jgi:endonuclease/exonuclease/phosphatase family metal-dependent hydrolase
MIRRRKYKHNGSRQRRTLSGRLILTSFCCRRYAITTPVLASVKRSRQEFIKSQFALRLGNHSKVDWVQQVAILSKYQAQAAWAEPWKSMNGVDPPRGFAFAWFKIGSEEIGVDSVHLKSNLITHGDREAETAKNIQKREIAITQLLTHVHDVVSTTMPAIKGIVIGGDFNTNHDQDMFAGERTLDSLATAGYQERF